MKTGFSIRGRLGSSTQVVRNIGVLLGFIFGASVDYKTIPCISGILPIAFAIIFVMLPNTPRYYLQKGQYQVSQLLNSHEILFLRIAIFLSDFISKIQSFSKNDSKPKMH